MTAMGLISKQYRSGGIDCFPFPLAIFHAPA